MPERPRARGRSIVAGPLELLAALSALAMTLAVLARALR
jgi:hypothetical protein